MFTTLLILAFSSLANSKFETFIVGGKEVPIERWAFIAFIEANYGPTMTACGGSLLSSQTVLTAAHCLDDVTKRKKLLEESLLAEQESNIILSVSFHVYMGHAYYLKSKMLRRVKDYETHSNYDPDSEIVNSDIGIMFLVTPVKFISNVLKAVLVKATFNSNTDRNLMVAGWGKTDPTGTDNVSPKLKEARMTSISARECKRRQAFVDSKLVICAESSKEYAYSGDSGGPMVRREDRHQLGIVSYRNELTGVTVFTSVPAHYDWIAMTQYRLFKKHCNK